MRDSLALFLNGQYAGTLFHALSVDDRYKRVAAETRLAVTTAGLSAGTSASMAVVEQRIYGLDGTLASARQELSSAAGSTVWTLARKAGGWRFAVETGGISRLLPEPRIAENLAMAYALYTGIRERSIRAGDTLRDTMFDLATGQPVYSTLCCSGTPSPENGPVWSFVARNSAASRDERWTLDSSGATLYQEIWPFTARKMAKMPAAPAAQAAPAAPLFEALAVPVSRAAASGEGIRLTFEPPFSPDTSVSAFYRAEGGSWVLAALPGECGGPGCRARSADTLRTFTDATVTMQSDDLRLRRLADSLVRGMHTRCDTIRALQEFVDASISNRYSPTFSSALETLNAGFGDCGEHAVLLGALLRAEGVPARAVFGLVCLKERQGYFYHAWVMVRACGAWLFADPALGVFPAPRDRIPLLIDDTGGGLMRLAPLIGRIKIDYVEKR
jgi:hypothetical protein